MIKLFKKAITDEVYGRELENGLISMFGFSLFTLTQVENPGTLMISLPAIVGALYVKYPSMQKMIESER